MWQAAVATGAVSVPALHRGLRELPRVAAAAQAAVGLGELEGVRFVTLSASQPTVKFIVLVGRLMAAAAGFCRLAGMRAGRVRLVTARAAASCVEVGVIRMHAGVAIGARALHAAAHVVRSMAALAISVGGHTRSGQDVHLGVTGAARPSRLLLEFVRPMTANTLAVPASKERSGWHQWLLVRVTSLAARARCGGRSMLVLMTRCADVLGGLVGGRMARRNLAMTIRAGAWSGSGVLVRAVATQALTAAMHDHGGSRALADGVTASAVTWREFTRRRRFCGGGRRRAQRHGEGMTQRAIRVRFFAEALRRLLLGVAQATLGLVTGNTARR
jgi:hypothetical protein